MAAGFVLGFHGEVEYKGKRLAGLWPREQVKAPWGLAHNGAFSSYRCAEWLGVATPQARLEMWLTGWRTGDAEMILRSVADDFVYDDPLDGLFRKAEFAADLESTCASESPFVTWAGDTVFEEISHAVAQEQDGELPGRMKNGAPNGIRIRAAGLKGQKYLQNRREWGAMLRRAHEGEPVEKRHPEGHHP